jgi:hypothetical protein
VMLRFQTVIPVLQVIASPVWCNMNSYRVDRPLIVISTCKFRTVYTMDFETNGATIGKESVFCITITHRGTHIMLFSNSSPRKAFLSSPNHHNLRISLPVTSGDGCCATIHRREKRSCHHRKTIVSGSHSE